jgi:Cys-tRNA(Pro)/Cys-tRNA(Cys) deacylase
VTPAIDAARKAGIAFKIHSYRHDPSAKSYGEEVAAALGLDPERVFKTLIATAEAPAQMAVAVIPIVKRLDLKALATVLAVKKMALAEETDAERATGYVIGGISPLGQRKRLPLVLDASALAYATIYVSAGRRGLEIELAPVDLLKLSEGKTGAIVR